MSGRSSLASSSVLAERAPILEPLIIISITSLVSSWAMQPFVGHALAQQGTIAQSAAQAALWLSGMLSPFAAFAKAIAAALTCWACAIFLDERLSFPKLLSIFCLAEMIFAARDVATVALVAIRGLDSMRAPSDLLVVFGLGAMVGAKTTIARLALESWDLFTVAWGVLACWMIRSKFRTGIAESVCLAIVVVAVRVLFTGASLLYSV
jgi:hypothetical protein